MTKNLLPLFLALLILSSCKSKVEDIPVQSVTLDKETESIPLGATLQLTATVKPDNATKKEVSWSSSEPSTATVAGGLVTPVKDGITIISATAGGITAKCTVTVLVSVAGVSVDKEKLTLVIGKPGEITATVAPENATNKTVEWSSDKESIATVTANGASKGVITAKALGTCKIMATSKADPTKMATCTVTVVADEIPVNNILVEPLTANLEVKGTRQLTPKFDPENATNKNVTWTSDKLNIAEVSATGMVTAKGLGSAIITVASAANPDKKATCEITVTSRKEAVTNITAAPVDTTLMRSGSFRLRHKILPTNATNMAVTFESNDMAKVIVSTDGLVTANAIGEATITVKSVDDPTKTATCKVTVVELMIPITGISINPASENLVVNTTRQLTAIIVPTNATNKGVSWTTSAATVAEVSSTGLVTAKIAGTATITVKSVADETKTATCTITVTNQPVAVTGITATPTETTANVGATFNFIPTIEPATATNTNVTFESNDEDKATVSPIGVVTAKAPGTVTITVKSVEDPTKTATCVLTIKKFVTSITLAPDVVSIGMGQTRQLTATPLPSDAPDKTLTWSTGDETKATVSATGLVTARALGTVVITATANDGSNTRGTSTVTVTQVATSIIINPATPVVAVVGTEATITFTATVVPTTAIQTVTWTSSAPAVATINATGVATGVIAGTTTITATATDGSGITVNKTLIVKSNDASVSAITLGAENFSVGVPANGATTTVAHIPRVLATGLNSTVVNITTRAADATIKIGTAAFTQGQTVNLNSAFTFSVTAPDGTTVNNYTVAITPYNETSNPYGIYTVKHLRDVNNGLGNSYLVKNDITLPNIEAADAVELTGIGDYATNGWQPLGWYTGKLFDGGGHSINNFYFNRQDEYMGFFARLASSTAQIKNLGVKCRENTTSKGGRYTGILVGYNDQGHITNCFTTGKVESSSTQLIVDCLAGGLVGYMYVGNIVTSYSTAIVTASGRRNSYAGGLVGHIEGNPGSTPNIQNCYATGNVSSSGRIASASGGLAGWTESSVDITNCYATGNISASRDASATAYAGGLVGKADLKSHGKLIPKNSYRNSSATLTQNGTVVTVVDDHSHNGHAVIDKTYTYMQTDAFKDQLNGATTTLWSRSNGKNNSLPYIYGVGVGK